MVISADWDSSAQLYHVILQDTETGAKQNVDAEIIISAIGGFIAPAFPKDVPGADTFKGDIFHSAQWRHDVDLRGKRVGVIGNGCSAYVHLCLCFCFCSNSCFCLSAQFIPKIVQEPTTDVINFCRTPAWFVPRVRHFHSFF